MLPARSLSAAAAVLALMVALSSALGLRRGRGRRLRPDLPQGPEDRGAASTSLKLPLQLGLVAEPVGDPEGDQGREQPGLLVLRQVPVAVDAGEQVRRLVVEAQGGRQGVQGPGRDREGRRHPPARERHGDRSARRRSCSARSGRSTSLDAAQGGDARRTRPSSRRASRATSTPSPACAYRLSGGSSSAARPRRWRRRHADADRHPGLRLRAHHLPDRARLQQRPVPNQILTAYGIAPLQARASRARARGWRSSARRRRRRPT